MVGIVLWVKITAFYSTSIIFLWESRGGDPASLQRETWVRWGSHSVKSAKYRDQPNTTDNGVNLRRWRYRAIAPGNLRIALQHGYNRPVFWRIIYASAYRRSCVDATDWWCVCGRSHDTAPILKQGGLPHFIDSGNSDMLSISHKLWISAALPRERFSPVADFCPSRS